MHPPSRRARRVRDRARGRGRWSHGAQSGQSSLEYAGLLGVVAGVLVVVASITGVAGIANAVGRGLERALCVVGGGDCYATELHACAVRSSEASGRLGIKLTFVELGGRLSLLREEMSDGTVDVTLVDGGDVAPTAAVGAQGGVRLGGHGLGTGAIASAELLVRLGRRQVWHVADAAAADRLVRDVKRDVAVRLATHAAPGIGAPIRMLAHLAGVEAPKLPAADEVGLAAGVEGVLAARLPGGSGVSAGLEGSLGGSRDRATGRTTFVLGLEGRASSELAAAVGGLGLSASAGASAAVTYDRSGAPLDLAVSVAGAVAPGATGAVDVPLVRARAGAADRIERTTHLDLTRPDNRAAYEALMRALATPSARDLGPALAGLGRRLGQAGRQDLTRSVTRSVGYGAQGEVALGARIGGEAEVTRTAMVLRDSWTRPAGGGWERRTDCLGAAGRGI